MLGAAYILYLKFDWLYGTSIVVTEWYSMSTITSMFERQYVW